MRRDCNCVRRKASSAARNETSLGYCRVGCRGFPRMVGVLVRERGALVQFSTSSHHVVRGCFGRCVVHRDFGDVSNSGSGCISRDHGAIAGDGACGKARVFGRSERSGVGSGFRRLVGRGQLAGGARGSASRRSQRQAATNEPRETRGRTGARDRRAGMIWFGGMLGRAARLRPWACCINRRDWHPFRRRRCCSHDSARLLAGPANRCGIAPNDVSSYVGSV
jgi:hypothetical protein